MLLSSGMLSLFTLFAKFSLVDIPYFLLIFLRFGVAFLLLLPFLLWKTPIHELFHTANFKIQLLRIGCILTYQYAILYYLTYANLLDATVLQNTAPLFMPILEWIFFKHRFNARVIVSILISFAGVLCILQPERDILTRLSVVGILAPLGQAGSQVLYSHQARKENQKANLFYLFFLCSLVTGIIFLFSRDFVSEKMAMRTSALIWINVAALAVTSIFNQFFRGMAYQHGKASALAPFFYFSLFVSGLFDWMFFHHVPNRLSFLGAILVVGGGVIQVYKRK